VALSVALQFLFAHSSLYTAAVRAGSEAIGESGYPRRRARLRVLER